MQELEQAIRERAYHLWVADGCRDGNADTHWLSAQREVLASSLGNFARVTVSDVASAKAEKKSATTKAVPASRKKRRAA
jgi:Protein of unknown function (DUF2934)